MNLELITPITPAAPASTLFDVVDQISYAAEVLGNAKVQDYAELLEGLLDSEEYEAAHAALPIIRSVVNELIIAARR